MADINFDCAFCQQNLDAPEDMAGMEIECPACGKTIRVPSPPPARAKAPVPPIRTASRKGKAEAASADDEDLDQNKTTRMEIPEEFQKPQPKHRVVFIKRSH